MERTVQVTFDCSDPHSLARWWADLLGHEVEDNHDMVTGLLEQGVLSTDDVVEIDGRLGFAEVAAAGEPNGRGPRLLFQHVPEPKVGKARIHLDVPVEPEDLEPEVERVVAAGGTFVEYRSHPGHRWAVMQDPEGNEFCLH